MKNNRASTSGGADVRLTIHLNDEQLTVLKLLSQARISKEIASETGLSPSRINRIRHDLLTLFDANNLTALLNKARCAGILPMEDARIISLESESFAAQA